jgi:predicted PurR-regulated permease PerM
VVDDGAVLDDGAVVDESAVASQDSPMVGGARGPERVEGGAERVEGGAERVEGGAASGDGARPPASRRGESLRRVLAAARERRYQQQHQAPLWSDRRARRESTPVEHPDDAVPIGVRVASSWAWRLLLIGLFLYVLMRVLGYFRLLVIPLLVALLVVALVKPVTDMFERARMGRALSSLLTVLGVLAVVGGLIALVGTQIASGFPELQRQAGAGLTQVQEWLAGPPLRISTSDLAAYLERAKDSLTARQSTVVNGALAATTTAGHVVTGFFLTLFATFFFLAHGASIWTWLVRLFPRAARDAVDDASRLGWVTLTSFVRATVIVALVDAIGIGVGAAILHVPLAVPLGVLVFLSAFIPIVGALFSGAVAVLVALVAQGPVTALIMLGVVLLVQQVESHGLQPFLMGRAVRVHPLAVILAIAAGATVGGIVGALFAVPLIAVGNTVVLSLVGRSAEDPSVAHRPGPDEGGPQLGQPGAEPEEVGEPAPPDRTGEVPDAPRGDHESPPRSRTGGR